MDDLIDDYGMNPIILGKRSDSSTYKKLAIKKGYIWQAFTKNMRILYLAIPCIKNGSRFVINLTEDSTTDPGHISVVEEVKMVNQDDIMILSWQLSFKIQSTLIVGRGI